ncbi:MAG: ATP-binding protein [Anaerolineae bacterium]|nr:ATP-binding protein [Anaerolineae bacterium]
MQDNRTINDILTQPKSVEELDIPQNILIDILLRLLYTEGYVDFKRMSQVMRVPHALEQVLDWLRKEHLIEVSQSSTSYGPLNYIYKLTGAGEDRAREAMDRCKYIGPVPVPVNRYNEAIELQTTGPRMVKPAQVKDTLNELVLPAEFHRKIGPAINSAASLFLYGPPGNGKTTISMQISKLISGTDPIWLPYALTAGGQIIQIYDRLFHQEIEREQKNQLDGRWGLFKRPSVVGGGEMRIEALDLRWDPLANFYEAPLQIKANGGVFLIDDFGRQQASPIELLNRWIMPLENGVDFLRLRTGQTLVIPFRALIIFCTNLDPYNLADEAFFRRIQMKVGIFTPDEASYKQIFKRVCKQLGIYFDQESYQHLIDRWYHQSDRPYQAVHPRDILTILRALCVYEEKAIYLSPELIDEACEIYFVKH